MASPSTSRAVSIALTLSALALCALFIARGATSYAATKLLVVDGVSATARSAAQQPGASPPDVRAILARNAFDPETGSLPKPAPLLRLAEPPSPTPDPKKRPAARDRAAKLAAAAYAERAPGDEVLGPPSDAAAVATPEASEPELDAAITKYSETHYDVKRAFVDKLLGDPSQLMRLARAMPYEENGQVLGVKLYAIRRSGVLGRLGLQNGDLLHDINGFRLADPNSALEAFAKLRSASDLKVAITRRGQAMSLRLGITE